MIISYDLLWRNQADFSNRPDGKPWGMLIADEAHFIKDKDAKRSQATISVGKS